MDVEYYTNLFSKYADATEEDAERVKQGAVEMSIVDSITNDSNDRVAHQASIILGFNMYENNKDGFMRDICYQVCTADTEIDKVVTRCDSIVNPTDSSELEDDIETLTGLIMLADKECPTEDLGYVSEEIQRAFLVKQKPEYNQLDSNIDYILYELLDVLELNTDKSKEYVYKHKEEFIRPIMNLVLRSGDIILMEQMKHVYTNWMEWR